MSELTFNNYEIYLDEKFVTEDEEITLTGDLTVGYDFQPYEPRTYYEPGCPASVSIYSVKITIDGKDRDITNEITKREAERLEEAIGENLESQFEDYEEPEREYEREDEFDY